VFGLIVIFVAFCSGFIILFEAKAQFTGGETVKVMPLGDSITSGYTLVNDTVDPDPVGYRQKLWVDLNNSGYNMDFVGSRSTGDSKIPPFFDSDHEGWVEEPHHG
jgi:hypothetical protein